MILNVDLHLRPSLAEEHRSLGVIEVETSGPRLAPYQDITYRFAGREMRAHVTSIRQRPDHLPHVYADEVCEDELVA